MHSYFQQAAALPSGAIAAAAHGGGGGEGATTSSAVNGASLLQNALYGARSGSAAMHPGTALYRVLNAAPREKSLLASAVEDAFSKADLWLVMFKFRGLCYALNFGCSWALLHPS